MRDLKTIIKRGKDYSFFYDYDGEKIRLRPLSSFEFDDAQYRALDGIDPHVAGIIVRIRLNLHRDNKFNLDEIPEWMYKGYAKFINEYDYWVVYHALKDFYPDTDIETVREMKYVHAMATAVILASTPLSKREITRFVKTKEGMELGELVFRYHQPLDFVRNLTPLQEEFLYYADPSREVPEIITKEELYKIFPELKENVDE